MKGMITVETKSSNIYVRIEKDVEEQVTKLVDINELSVKELDNELEKGYVNILEGQVKSAKQVFSEICKDYGIR